MSNAQTIFDRLRKAGMSEAGALGVMGNLQAESGLEPCRIQGDFAPDRAKSHAFAEQVDSGQLPVDRASTMGLGWGLAQWTFPSRLRGLILYCMGISVSISDLGAQVDYLIREMRQDYPSLWQFLCETDNLATAVSRTCKEFERPAVNNISARIALAEKLSAQVSDDAAPEPDQAAASRSEFWPPRTVAQGMDGADIMVLQALLLARGYYVGGVTGIFDTRTHNTLLGWQADAGLETDGICGPKTWAKLLERGR